MPALQLRRRSPEPEPVPEPAPTGSSRRRVPALIALAAAVVVAGAGVASALVVGDDDEADPPTAAELIAGRFPTTYVVTSIIDDELRYQVSVSAVYDPSERYVVTVYRRFDPPELPHRLVGGDEVWTGFDDEQLQAVYVRVAEGDVAVRVSHQGPTPVPLADLTTLAQDVAADPTVVTETG